MCSAVRAASAANATYLAALSPPPNVVVVGGTAGIGRAIAASIGKHCPAANITVIGRNQVAADALLSELAANEAASKGNYKFLRADASLMSEIRSVTKKIEAVDMLILTQGILTMAGRTPTAENIDNKLALHYYGRMLFVQELLPLLRASPRGGKVLFVLDSTRGNPSKINWDDMALEKSYSLTAAAAHAITFTDLAIQHLASVPENSNVTFTHAYPGGVRTEITKNLPGWAGIPLKGLMTVLPFLSVSPEECAEFMIHGLLGTENGYKYVDNKGEPVTAAKVVDKEMATKVWDHTSQIISSNDSQ